MTLMGIVARVISLIIGVVAFTYAGGGPDLVPPGKTAYVLVLPKASTPPVRIGQYVDIGVIYGHANHWKKETLLHRMLIVGVDQGIKRDSLFLDLAVDQTEAQKLAQAQKLPNAKILLRVVEK